MTAEWAAGDRWSRLKVLATGQVQWCDPVTGEVVDRERWDWSTRWAVCGIHSGSWRWVRRLGARPCGCTVNPLTRRRVLTRMDCPQHGLMHRWAR